MANVTIKPAPGAGCTICGDPDDGSFDSYYDPSFTLTPDEVRELISRLEPFATPHPWRWECKSCGHVGPPAERPSKICPGCGRGDRTYIGVR